MLRRECLPRTPRILRLVFVICIASVAFIQWCVREYVMDDFCTSKERIAKHHIDKLVFAFYPQWRAEHPFERCPSLDKLARFVGWNEEDMNDPWGMRYRMYCSDVDVIIVSFGPDAIAHTADDITSDQMSR